MNEYYGYPTMNQPQTRQYLYYFVKDKGEAFNWAIAPGNLLVFKDQDNIHFYTKSLGYSPYDRPVFETYTKEVQTQDYPSSDVIQDLREAMSELQRQISDIKNGGK